jgi:hypothetical protein
MNIDPRFIDVDFRTQPEYVPGYLPGQEPDPALEVCRSYEAAAPVYTMAQIRQHAERLDAENGGIEFLVTRVYNQGREGSCVANAAAQAHEVIQAKQYGRDRVTPLSAISLYKRIGRSAGSGAMVSDGLKESSTRGILPLDTPENRARFAHVMPATGFGQSFPQGWTETAAKFRIVEWLVCRSVEELLSAGINGHPACVGRSGHSISYLRLTMRPGRLASLYVNSWGSWGFGAGYMPSGFGADSESLIRSSSRWAYAVRAITAEAPQ